MISKIIHIMIQIYIFADSHKHFSESISEYKKRLGKQVELIELKPVKKWTPQQIIKGETDVLIEKLEQNLHHKILLSPQWKNLSTLELGEVIENQKNSGKKIVFVIGWANGLDYDVLRPHVDLELSLWKMIFPHSLALTVLLEQVYRCNEIERGSGYHK